MKRIAQAFSQGDLFDRALESARWAGIMEGGVVGAALGFFGALYLLSL